jgi:alanine dehydrogenase
MSSGKYSGFSDVAKQAMMQTQESMLEIKTRKNKLYIGIPKEVSFQENRIPLTPLSVALLVNNGHDVLLESNAGKAANFLDKDYSEQGGRIVYDTKSVYEADIIIKIAPPTMAEIEMMKPGQLLISTLQVATMKADILQALLAKKLRLYVLNTCLMRAERLPWYVP